jgi:iron complex transport system ATP-binding protein
MINVDNVSFSYNEKVQIIRDVTTEIEDKKITTILGHNGCGKTTLLKLIAHLIRPQAGSISLDGKDVSEFSNKNLAKRIALLAQKDYSSDITVEQLVSFGRYPYQRYGMGLSQKDKDRVDYALREIHIEQFRNNSILHLSGGQKQKVYIALALAQDTDIIILDEPTTYLDINVRFEIMDLVKRLNQSGKTIVMVLHDLDLALEYSDNIILMDQGRIVIQGPKQEVIESKMIEKIFNVELYPINYKGKTVYHFMRND